MNETQREFHVRERLRVRASVETLASCLRESEEGDGGVEEETRERERDRKRASVE